MATNDPKSGKNKSLFRNQSPTARWKQLEDWSDEKKFYHCLGHTLIQIQKKDELFQRGDLIVENERYCLIHILPINIVNNSHQKYVYINYQSIRT